MNAATRGSSPHGRRIVVIVALLLVAFLERDAVSGSCYQWVNGVLTPGFECTYMNERPSSGGRRDYIDPGPPPVPPQDTPEQVAQRARQAEEQRLRAEEKARQDEILRQQELARHAESERLRESYELHTEALRAHNSGDLTGAIALYQRALEKDPGNQTIQNNLAIAERTVVSRQQDMERRRRNAMDFAKVQGIIDRIVRGQQGGGERPPLVNAGTGSDFFTTHGGKRLPSFGDPDREEATSGRARGGMDRDGALLGARVSKPADVVGTGRYDSNPRIIRARQELTALRTRRDKLDGEIQRVQIERNRTKDPKKSQIATDQVKKLNQEKQALLVQQVKKEEQIREVMILIDEGDSE